MNNSKEFKKAEIPSAFMIANGRSLGLLSAYMANKGTLNGKKLISEETWEKFHSEPKQELMNDLVPTVFSKGGCNHYGQTNSLLKECNP